MIKYIIVFKEGMNNAEGGALQRASRIVRRQA